MTTMEAIIAVSSRYRDNCTIGRILATYESSVPERSLCVADVGFAMEKSTMIIICPLTLSKRTKELGTNGLLD